MSAGLIIAEGTGEGGFLDICNGPGRLSYCGLHYMSVVVFALQTSGWCVWWCWAVVLGWGDTGLHFEQHRALRWL